VTPTRHRLCKEFTSMPIFLTDITVMVRGVTGLTVTATAWAQSHSHRNNETPRRGSPMGADNDRILLAHTS
jgi:hypothetical protein